MADAHFRAFERQWRTTASVDDEARYLGERVRAGSLPARRLELAAYLGHPAARRAVGRPVPAPDDLWPCLRGLETWSSELAIWALAEALDDPHLVLGEPDDIEQYPSAIAEVRSHFHSGKLLELAQERELWFALTAGSKELTLALGALGRDRHYLPDDDPEVLDAMRRVVERFPLLHADRWRYNHVEREGTEWVHVFRYLRPADPGELDRSIPVAPGWSPPPGHRAVLPGRRGVLGHFGVSFSDEAAARARVEAALIPWALAPQRAADGG